MAELIVTDVPESVRSALTTAARSEGVSVNAVACRILCDRFNITDDTTRRSYYRPQASSSRMVFRVPDPLRDIIRIEAASADVTMGSIVRATLADHFGIPGIQPRPRITR